MPIGIQRINAKKSQPNDRIVFIKPLNGPDEAISQDFLERVAAQCLPIMREHNLSVMSLEEHEPNNEFVGRNFNAGEIVQLVLKTRFTGHWLPFDYVQMVMMHELAHCRQMNHSKAFWVVRNAYAEQMRALWSRGYTGEGLWGRGALLSTGEFEKNVMRPDEHLPEHLCGGTYRSRPRKRKAKNVLTYQEQKERRILKKFGANGVALGEDREVKQKLEKGRRVAAKPRVAASARGRELRAAAALARFEQQKKEEKDEEAEPKKEEGESDETDGSEDDETEADSSDTIRVDGKRLVKVCEDEDSDDQDARQEFLELQSSMRRLQRPTAPLADGFVKNENASTRNLSEIPRASKQAVKSEPELEPEVEPGLAEPDEKPARPAIKDRLPVATKKAPIASQKPPAITAATVASSGNVGGRICPICSFSNEGLCVTCTMCANVLAPHDVPGSWSCRSRACQESKYLNAGDCGVCGVCGERRSTAGG